jgi:hypothetical protein
MQPTTNSRTRAAGSSALGAYRRSPARARTLESRLSRAAAESADAAVTAAIRSAATARAARTSGAQPLSAAATAAGAGPGDWGCARPQAPAQSPLGKHISLFNTEEVSGGGWLAACKGGGVPERPCTRKP